MNIVLFETGEWERPLRRDDPRSRHILGVLRRNPGDRFDAGVIGGNRGKATLVAVTEEGLRLELRLDDPVAPLHPVTLLFGACRPVAARRILREAASLGVEEIWACGADTAEASYLKAALWSGHEYREHLVSGAAQAFSTRIPTVCVLSSLDAAVDALRSGGSELLALDNYEAGLPLRDWIPAGGRTTVAVGPERGWSARERSLMRDGGFALVGLGDRVLRADTACLVGAALVLARRRLL